jgi:hypothetical protein
LPPGYSGKNRNKNVTVAAIDSSKDKIAMGTDNGMETVAADTDNSNISIVIDIAKSKITDSSENKDNKISITNDKVRKKEIGSQSTLSKREKDISSREKQKELSENYKMKKESDEGECSKQKEDVSSISLSDVETQLKNLVITMPEGELCEPSSEETEKYHSSDFRPYSVCCPI